MWSRTNNYDVCRELYTSVVPESDRHENLMEKFPEDYQAFIYTENNAVLAFSAVSLLPESNVLVIDLFALDESIRGKGLSRKILGSFLSWLPSVWTETKTAVNHILLEAYNWNIDPWLKILNTTIFDTHIKPKKISKPATVLIYNITNPEKAYHEWQNFQNSW